MLINSISKVLGAKFEGSYEGFDDEGRGKLLEDVLTTVCLKLGEAKAICEHEDVDVEYLLSIVGSYLLARESNSIKEGDAPPAILFEESLFPSLRNTQPIDVEVIDGESTGQTTETVSE